METEVTMPSVQAEYPKKQPMRPWDPVHLEYPVRKFPETGESSVTIGHRVMGKPEVLKALKEPLAQIKEYYHDYNIERNLMRSQTTIDFVYKHPDTKRHNKHTSCTENLYIYPPSRRLTDQPPQCNVHGTTEMKSAYKTPTTPPRLVTAKEQIAHAASPIADMPFMEPRYPKSLEPLDTTHEGFEKYLDPYLTTSRLHHRPYTADQLSRESNASARDIVTYYTFSDTPMVRTQKTKPEFWRLPLPRPKPVYDREKFKNEFREIRTHNKLTWVPGSFRTEIRDNFDARYGKSVSIVDNLEEDVRSLYKRRLAHLPTVTEEERAAILQGYSTENSVVGSKKPLCCVFNPYPDNNKKLEIRENKMMQKHRLRT